MAAVTLRMVRFVLTPEAERVEDVRILAIDRHTGRVELSAHTTAVLPGRYSLYFDQGRGYAQVGEVVATSGYSDTRELLVEGRGTLRPGIGALMSAWFYESPADFEGPFDDVNIQTVLGPSPAWLVSAGTNETGYGSSWAIQVHGRGVDRRETLLAIPVFRAAGYTSLLISYRNDGVAPASVDGRYALGDTEWSMGGALVLQTFTRSVHASYIRGLVLGSPVIDWVRVLEHQASAMNLPQLIRSVVYRLISSSWGARLTGQAEPIDLRRLDFVHRAEELSVPVLLMHSDSDPYVLADGSAELARLRPDLVCYARFEGAGHTRLWNYDEAKWVDVISCWLSRLS